MGAGTAKLELILELRNRINSGLSSARTQLNSGISSMKAKMAELKGGASELFNGIASQIPGVGGMIGSLANPYAAAAAGVLALGAAYLSAGQMAVQWQTGMAKVNVTAQLNRQNLKLLSDQVLDIGGRNATPLEEIPDSFNKVVSAGLNAKDALEAFDPILKGAKAGFTDLNTVAAATVSTMNSTGLKDASQVLDVLFATMNKGNAEFADIANYLPKIIPMAEKAGQSFKDTAGAFAYFTAQGFKSEQTATLLENTFKAISDPRITDGFKKVGVNIYDSAGKAKPMLKILDDLRGRLSGLSSQAKNKIFQTIGADGETVTAIGAMLKDYDKLADIIKFTNDSQGQLNEAMKNAETPMDAWAIIFNQVKQAMIEIGQTSLPIIKAIGTYILETIQYWKDLYANSIVFRDSLSAIGVYFQYLWAISTIGIRFLINGFKMIGDVINRVTTSIFGSGDGFEKWYIKVKPYVLWVFQYIKAIGEMIYNIQTLDFSGAMDAAKSISNGKSIEVIRNEVNAEYKAQKEAKKEVLAPIGGVKPDGTGGKTKNLPVSSSASGTTGTAQQVKNITINMDAMVKGVNLSATGTDFKGMGKKEFEEYMQNMFKRMMGNLETSYG